MSLRNSFRTLWIFIVFVGTLNDDILLITVLTERDKSPKKWSLEFDLTKIKMFTGEDKRWRLVSRCWNFMVMNHGVIYWDDRKIRDPIWEGNFDFELISFNFEVNFHHISAGPQALNYFKQHCLLILLLLSHWGL